MKTYGSIVEVATVNIGENVTAAASSGATTIAVADPTTFKESGGQVTINESIYTYTGIDVTASTITLASPGLEAAVAEDDRVELYPAEPLKRAFIDLGIPEGEAIQVTVPHALTAVLDEGLREEANRETVLLEERGVGKLFLADVASTPATLQSSTYVQGQTGWAFGDLDSQIDNLNIVSELGADTISARTILLDGQDLGAEGVGTLAKGVIASDTKDSGTATATVTTTETKLYEFSAGQMYAGRLYRMSVQGYLNGSVGGDVFAVRVHYTLDGSAPTTASPNLRTVEVEMQGTTNAMFDYSKVFTIASDTDNFRTALTLQRLSGTGNAQISYIRSLDFNVEDVGSYEAAAAAGTLSQKSYEDATPADADPVRSYTKTWWATWTRSYQGDNSIDPDGETGPDSGNLYHGYVSSNHGNHRSLIGFDYAAIQSALSGATIVSVKFTFRIKHTWSTGGADISISSHSYTSKPSTWSGGSVTQNRYNSTDDKEGSTKTKSLPVAVGNEFKAGTTRGLGFGPAPNNSASSYYCYMYGGETSSSRPRLTVTYTK